MDTMYSQKTGIYPSIPTQIPTATADPDSRDPHDINKHLRLDFLNVIAEPDESAHSCEVFHGASGIVYRHSKLFIYRLLTIVVGLPLMLFWGLAFGVYTFLMIWLAAPSRRLFQSLIAESGLYVQTLSDAVIAPLHRSMGYIFSNVRINLTNQTVNSIQQVNV